MSIDVIVREACQELLLKCKAVIENVEKRGSEDEQMEALKASAAATFKLGNIVHDHITSRQEKSTTQIQEGFLFTYTEKLRESVVLFLKNSRRAFANPFDYLTEQDLKNALKELVSITKQVVEAAKTLAEAEREEESDGSFDEDDSTSIESSSTSISSAASASASTPTTTTASATSSTPMPPATTMSTQATTAAVVSTSTPITQAATATANVQLSAAQPKQPPPVPPRSTKPTLSSRNIAVSDASPSPNTVPTNSTKEDTSTAPPENEREADKALSVVDSLTQMLEASSRLEQAVLCNDVQTFADTARFILTNLPPLITSLTAIGRSPENNQSIRESCIKMMNAAKIAVKKPNDAVLYEQLKTANEEFVTAIRNNIFEVSVQNRLLTRSPSRPKLSDHLLRHASMMLVSSPVATPRSSITANSPSIPSPATTSSTPTPSVAPPTTNVAAISDVSTSIATTTSTTTVAATSSSNAPSDLSESVATPTSLAASASTSDSSPSLSQLAMDPQRAKLMKQIRAHSKNKVSSEQPEEETVTAAKATSEKAEKKRPRKKTSDTLKKSRKVHETSAAESETVTASARHTEPTTPTASASATATPTSTPTIPPTAIVGASPRGPLPVTISKAPRDIKVIFAERIIDLIVAYFPQLKKELSNETERLTLTHKIVSELAEYQIRILFEKEVRAQTTAVSGTLSPRESELPSTASPLKKKDKEIHSTVYEKKQKKHRSVKELHDKDKEETKKERDRRRITGLGPTGNDPGPSVSFANDPEAAEDKITSELQSYMNMNSDWSQAMSMRLKGTRRGTLTWLKKRQRKPDKAPATPNELIERTREFTRTVCDLLAIVYDLTKKPADDDVDSKLTNLGLRVQNVFDHIKALLDCLHDVVGTLKEDSGLAATLARIQDEIENVATRGTIAELDTELLSQGHYAQLIQNSFTRLIYDQCIALENLSAQISVDVVILHEKEKDKSQSLNEEVEALVLHVLALVHCFRERVRSVLNDWEMIRYIALYLTEKAASTKEINAESSASSGSAMSRSQKGSTSTGTSTSTSTGNDNVAGVVSLWDDVEPDPTDVNNPLLNPNNPYRAGTLNNLVRRLTPEDKNAETVSTQLVTNAPLSLPEEETPRVGFFKAFLLTYRSFTNASTLLDKLLERYHVPPKAKLTAEETRTIKQRVCDVIKWWLNESSHDLDETHLSKLRRFIETSLRKDKLDSLATNLLENLKDIENWWLSLATVAPPKSPPKEISPLGMTTSPLSLMEDYDELVIAQQLTQVEFDIYKRIGSWELQGQAWNKKPLQPLARNVITLIQRANRVSFWLATTILLQPRIKDRARVLKKIITVAKHLRDLNNFNTLMGFVAALNTSPISRLKHTFNAVPKNLLETMKALQQVVDPTSSFKQLREAIKATEHDLLPYLGTYLTDITFIDDGNPDYVTVGNKKLINFDKWRLIYVAIQQIRSYQQSKFNFGRHEPLTSFLVELPALGEHELYKLSLEREPRDVERSDIR